MQYLLRTAMLLPIFALSVSAYAQSSYDQQNNPGPARVTQGQPGAELTDEQYIALLEQMLRNAGIEPPSRVATAPAGTLDEQPIIPTGTRADGLEPLVEDINARGDDAAPALARVRRYLLGNDERRMISATNILQAVEAWADIQNANVQALAQTDRVAAYIIADDALRVLRRDELGEELQAFVNELRTDRRAYRELEAMAGYRRAFDSAMDLGLMHDWSNIDIQDNRVMEEIERLRARMNLVTRGWPGTQGAHLAQEVLDTWAQREAQAIANRPAWRYTWNISLIHLGTEETTRVYTNPVTGAVTITEEQRQVFDQHNIVMYGTFRNNSDRPYQYTFTVGVSRQSNAFTRAGSDLNDLDGYAEVQTPTLAPGEVHQWSTQIAVRDAWNIQQGGIGNVEAIEP